MQLYTKPVTGTHFEEHILWPTYVPTVRPSPPVRTFYIMPRGTILNLPILFFSDSLDRAPPRLQNQSQEVRAPRQRRSHQLLRRL